MKKLVFLALALTFALADCSTAPTDTGATSSPLKPGGKAYSDLVVGFAQVGAESEWRTAETNSIIQTADDLNVELKFSDGQNRQDLQIAAIRSFIAQGVDVIVVAPVVATGWEPVFQEARNAGIPIVLVDRKADVSKDLFATFVGSDFVLEGENACKQMAAQLGDHGSIVELQGSVGADPAIDRQAGFARCLKDHPNMTILASESGNFTRAEGKEVMRSLLHQYGKAINGVYAHNDDMALGAVEAITEYGLRPGMDIKIVSIDGVRGAFDAMLNGSLNCTVECNPLLGPQVFDVALKLANGEPVDRWVKSNEGVYCQSDITKAMVSGRKY